MTTKAFDLATLMPAGGQIAGALLLRGPPTSPTEAADKAYVDGSVGSAVPSTILPVMDGAAVVGTSTKYSREDHVHPSDTSRYAASNPSGYQTSAQVSALLASYAPLSSPALTNVPTAPTATAGTSTTQIATTQFVTAAMASLAPIASPVFTGDARAVTPSPGDSDTSIATTAFVMNAITASTTGVSSWNSRTGAVTLSTVDVTTVLPGAVASPLVDGTAAVGVAAKWAREDHVHPTDTTRYAASNPSGYQTAAQVTTALGPYAPLASPAFTGAPSLPTGATGVTQAGGTNNTTLATTAFVAANFAPVTGSTAYAPATGGSYVAKAGDTMTGALTQTMANPAINLNKTASGQSVAIVGETNGSNRWVLMPGNTTAESSTATGSDIQLNAYDNTGAYLGDPLLLYRSNGQWCYNGYGAASPAATGGSGSTNLCLSKAGSGKANNLAGYTSGVLRWNLALGDTTAEASNAGSNLVVSAFNDAGGAATVPTPLSIARGTGVATFAVAIVNGSSDRRLKERIQPLEGEVSLAKVKALTGVSFNFIATPDKPEIGLVAQDVQDVVPEVIQKFELDGEERLAIDYPKLTAHLIEAIKILSSRVEALERRR